MTLNLPLLYVLWLEEYRQISPNENKSPNLWHVTSILVCCIFARSCWMPPNWDVANLHEQVRKTLHFWFFLECLKQAIFKMGFSKIDHCETRLGFVLYAISPPPVFQQGRGQVWKSGGMWWTNAPLVGIGLTLFYMTLKITLLQGGGPFYLLVTNALN